MHITKQINIQRNPQMDVSRNDGREPGYSIHGMSVQETM